MQHPMIIQGGMGAAVSNWRLANTVSALGYLGVVSGTGMENVFIRRLQDGDPGGHMRRAVEQFPFQDLARRVWDRFFIEGGKAPDVSYKPVTMHTINPPKELIEITILSNYAEVFLAKEGHTGVVGINLLEKIQLPHLPTLYGAMLAGVDYVLMGAGIPREIPGALDLLSEHQPASLKLNVQGEESGDSFRIHFDPRQYLPEQSEPLRRPFFLPIIASVTLALTLAKKANGRVDGFIIEGPTAGGHNAPPRGAFPYNERGEPVYGQRDEVDLAKIREIGLPFWMAGSYADPERLREALAEGAQGIQVGTAFALCEESGLDPEVKRLLLQNALDGKADVLTDAKASPTGFPFKVAQIDTTLSADVMYLQRPRNCDLGYLRTAYKREDGSLGYRCPAEPVDTYVKKGGSAEDAEGRKCLCNALMANIGLGQVQHKTQYHEQPLITIGDDYQNVVRFLRDGKLSYSAADVITYLTSLLHV